MQIKTNNLGHIYDIKTDNEFTALKNVNLQIDQGEFIAVIGHTGSGKTTLIEHLNGLLRPTSGEIHADEIIIKAKKRKIKKIMSIRKRIGVVFQFAEYQLFEETILKDIVFGPINMGATKEEAHKLAEKYIELVGLPLEYLKRSPFSLSGGQKRRVALAGILAMEPDVLIFDQPTAGLDPQGCIDMYEIFQKLNKEGRTIIVVTHDLDQVLKNTKRTIILSEGKIVSDGKTIDVMYDIEKILKNDLEPAQIVNIVTEIESMSKIKIGKIKNIDELVSKL